MVIFTRMWCSRWQWWSSCLMASSAPILPPNCKEACLFSLVDQSFSKTALMFDFMSAVFQSDRGEFFGHRKISDVGDASRSTTEVEVEAVEVWQTGCGSNEDGEEVSLEIIWFSCTFPGVQSTYNVYPLFIHTWWWWANDVFTAVLGQTDRGVAASTHLQPLWPSPGQLLKNL